MVQVGTGTGPQSLYTHLLACFVPRVSEVRASVEGKGELAAPSLPSPSSLLQPSEVPVKLNTAAILREGSLYQQQVEKELQRWGRPLLTPLQRRGQGRALLGEDGAQQQWCFGGVCKPAGVGVTAVSKEENPSQ